MEDTLAEYHDNLRKEQAEVALHRSAVKKQWKTNLGKALFAMQDCISFFLRLSLLVKDCQNPRDPLQPASKKKKKQWKTKDVPSFLHATSSRVYTQWRISAAAGTLSCGLSVKTTLERCGPFSLVVLSQRRSQVTPLSGHSDQNASETFSNKLQLNKVQSSLRQTSAKTTQVRSKAKTS